MSKDILDRLIKIESKMDDALVKIGQLDVRSTSIDSKVDLLHNHNNENLKFRFGIIWSVLGGFFACLSALTYRIIK